MINDCSSIIGNDTPVGHWLIVAGYNDKTQEIILLDPVNNQSSGDLAFTRYSYSLFPTYWSGQNNSAIGPGEMITIR